MFRSAWPVVCSTGSFEASSVVHELRSVWGWWLSGVHSLPGGAGLGLPLWPCEAGPYEGVTTPSEVIPCTSVLVPFCCTTSCH